MRLSRLHNFVLLYKKNILLEVHRMYAIKFTVIPVVHT